QSTSHDGPSDHATSRRRPLACRAMPRALSWWGWGFEDARLDAAALAEAVTATLGFGSTDAEEPARLEDVALRPPRIEVPADDLFSTDPRERIRHAKGRSYLDTVRAFRGRIEHPPDAVAFARGEDDIERVLEWAAGANVAVIPYGGGTSVVGGVEPRVPERFDGAVSLDLGGMDQVLELDPVSRA